MLTLEENLHKDSVEPILFATFEQARVRPNYTSIQPMSAGWLAQINSQFL